MKRFYSLNKAKSTIILTVLILSVVASTMAHSQGFGIPSKNWGIGFGNSSNFKGIRFNIQDSYVENISGINITFWQPKSKTMNDAVIQGISLGIIPGGGTLRGIQLGVLGVAADHEISGITVGLLGMGSGGDIRGLNIGGLGIGAGGDIKGVNFAGLGVGTGGSLYGVTIAGLGAGAGENLAGFSFAILGLGAGKNMTGVQIAGLGAGAGNTLGGLTIAGLGAGAPTVRGVTLAGIGVGGVDIGYLTVAIGTIRVEEDGYLRGVAASAFNHVRGTQTGLSIGIVNYAWDCKGLQLGVINIVRNNPKGLRVLPVFNRNF